MLEIRRANERGHADHGWLNTYHTFSFADYHDPKFVRFRSLRVINEDRVAPGQGFGTHSHSDMEILTYVLSGALQHKDSMGNGETLGPGEFQCMSAGTGLSHSEFNASNIDPVHFYQIWLIPNKKGIKPSYTHKTFPLEANEHQLILVASPDGTAGSLLINVDARVFLGFIAVDESLTYNIDGNRHVWIQVISGQLELDGKSLLSSDGVAISNERKVTLHAEEPSKIMLFDLS